MVREVGVEEHGDDVIDFRVDDVEDAGSVEEHGDAMDAGVDDGEEVGNVVVEEADDVLSLIHI